MVYCQESIMHYFSHGLFFIAVSPSVILLDVKSFMISVFSYFVVEKVINIKLGFLKMFLRVLLHCTIIGSLK